MEPFLGQIQMFGFNFAPRGWAQCDGQLLAISQNSALFSLLGTTYGGDGRTTFALPDLRGRVALHQGAGPGLTNRSLGERSGAQTVQLNSNNLAAHTHDVTVSTTDEDGTINEAAGNILANTVNNNYAPSTLANGELGGVPETSVGQGQAFNIMQPYLVVNVCIALVGIFPSRN